MFLHFIPTQAQQVEKTQLDSVVPTHEELKAQHVDSMVRYIRKQFYRNNFDITIELGEQTLEKAQEINDLKSTVALSSLIGNAFLKIDDTLQAKRIFSEALKKAEKQHDSTNISITAQIDLGNYYALQGKSAQAIPIYKKAIPLSEKLKDTTHLYILNYNIAELYLNDEEPSLARKYVEQTNSYVKSLNPDAYHAGAKLLTGKLYYLENKNQQAIEVLQESIELSKSSGFMDGLIEGHEYLAKLYNRTQNYLLAYNEMQLLDSLKAEKYTTDKIEAIEYATAKYKLNEYQQELKATTLQNEIDQQTAKRETTIFWIKIASLILVVSSIFLFISYRKRKQLLVHLIDKNQQYLEAKERSEELAKAKTTLFSNITHELRTPMYGIIGISSIMMKDKSLAKHKENLWSLKFSANHLLSLINNVLQLTSIDRLSKKDLKKAKFSIHNIIANTVKSSKFITPDQPNEYKINIDKSIPKYLIGDDVKISQVLINLIGNAAKFTSNGIISITVNRKADSNDMVNLHFTIKDTGVGISEEKQQYIFDEFSNTDTTNSYRGTGLGLPIVKKILSLYDADIHLKSELGQGTEISFSLPYMKAPTINSNANGKIQPNQKVFKQRKVLVVDDNKINLLVTKKFLMVHGASVEVAENGHQAIAIAKETQFDAILMDINMPEINGFQATEAIREFDTQVPIIALTAVELEKVVGDHSFNLMNDFIIKPYENQLFIDTLLRHMVTEISVTEVPI